MNCFKYEKTGGEKINHEKTKIYGRVTKNNFPMARYYVCDFWDSRTYWYHEAEG